MGAIDPKSEGVMDPFLLRVMETPGYVLDSGEVIWRGSWLLCGGFWRSCFACDRECGNAPRFVSPLDGL